MRKFLIIHASKEKNSGVDSIPIINNNLQLCPSSDERGVIYFLYVVNYAWLVNKSKNLSYKIYASF